MNNNRVILRSVGFLHLFFRPVSESIQNNLKADMEKIRTIANMTDIKTKQLSPEEHQAIVEAAKEASQQREFYKY